MFTILKSYLEVYAGGMSPTLSLPTINMMVRYFFAFILPILKRIDIESSNYLSSIDRFPWRSHMQLQKSEGLPQCEHPPSSPIY